MQSNILFHVFIHFGASKDVAPCPICSPFMAPLLSYAGKSLCLADGARPDTEFLQKQLAMQLLMQHFQIDYLQLWLKFL